MADAIPYYRCRTRHRSLAEEARRRLDLAMDAIDSPAPTQQQSQS
jgi:hypothetical protein